jgi:TIR domain
LAADVVAAFFSYSRDDSSFVVRLAGDLKAAGANVWLDQLDILPGQRRDRAIEDALKNCPRLIVILSPSAVESTHVMNEVSFALEEQKTVIPVIYRDCVIPFRLRRLQYVDFKQVYAYGLKELLKVLSPQQKPERTTPAFSDVRKQIRTDLPETEERQTEPEKARLEVERRRAVGQARLEEGRTQTVTQELTSSFFSKFPAGAKVVVAVFTILIVALILYWKLLPSPSNKQIGETQKREAQVEATSPTPLAPQQTGETQKREARVETTSPTPVVAEALWYTVLASLPPDDLKGACKIAQGKLLLSQQADIAHQLKIFKTKESDVYAIVIGEKMTRSDALALAADARKKGIARDAFAQQDRSWTYVSDVPCQDEAPNN